MKKTLLSLAVLSVLSGSAFALTVSNSGSPYVDSIEASDGLDNQGVIQNDKVVVTGGQFTNTGSIQTGVLEVYTTNKPQPKFGNITATESITFNGADADSYNNENFKLSGSIKTPLLKILDSSFTSGKKLSTGLTINDPSVFDGIGEIYIESNGSRTGIRVGYEKNVGQTFYVKAPVTLVDKTGNEDARFEIFNDNHVHFSNVKVIGDKGMIQVNHNSQATVDLISVESNGILNFQTFCNTNKGETPSDYMGVVTLKEINLGESANLRASVFANSDTSLDVNYSKQSMPSLTLKGEEVTVNLGPDSLLDFGGWKKEQNSDWRPEDIIVDIQSMTINVEDSSSNAHVYLTGHPGNLKTKPQNIHVIGAPENNTGDAEADLTKLANVVKTNVKVVENNVRQNDLNCLPGVQLEQKATDILDGATGEVADGCPNCTITNVNIIKDVQPTPSPNVHGIAEMAALGLHIWRNEIDDMHRRVGELRDSSAQSNGLWTRVYHGKSEYGDLNVTNRYTGFQLGYDRQVDQGFWLGGAFSYTDGNNNFDYGDGDNYLYTFSGYGSWLFDNGVYLDLVGKVGRMNNEFDISANGFKSKGDYHTNAASISAEMGWRYYATEELYVEPQVQMWYGHVFDASYRTSTGVAVENDSVDSLVGRAGVKLGFKDNEGRGGVFVKASVLHDWKGDADFRFTKDTISRSLTESLGGTWYEYGLGADYNASKQVHFYADLEASEGGEVDTDYRVNFGVRYAW